MYKEFRDTSLNGAVGQLFMEMSGNHRANHDTIQIIRSSVLTKRSQIRRPKSLNFRNNKIRFPIVKSLARASQKKYRSVFKANRPTTYKSWWKDYLNNLDGIIVIILSYN